MFPLKRPRRLRRSAALRSLVRETSLSPDHFVLPLFVVPGKSVRCAIPSMPGQFQLSVDQILREAETAHSLGIPAVLLFGVPERKDAAGSGAWASNGLAQQATRALKKRLPGLTVVTDLCFCEYTSHGHCGFSRRAPAGSPSTTMPR